MGISGQLNQLVDLERLTQHPLPVIRRFSGGGTVVIDEKTLFVTFIFNQSSHPFSPYPHSIMQWTEEVYAPLFDPHPFRLRENDYVVGEQKIGGNAQSIIKNRWLHHSSFLWDFSDHYMDYLLYPPKTPDYRKRRGHAEFLGRLKGYFSQPDELQERLIEKLKDNFKIAQQSVDALEAIALRSHRQATKIIDPHF
jgi:lipoate-protein ligase A